MADDDVTRRVLPLILIRGFGGVGVEDEKRIAYQGFNDGTVYPQKRGENYIYEGLILRFMKSDWQYQDATNVVGLLPERRGGGDRRPAGPEALRPALLHRRPNRHRRGDGAQSGEVGGRSAPDVFGCFATTIWMIAGSRPTARRSCVSSAFSAIWRRSKTKDEPEAQGQYPGALDGRPDRARSDPGHVSRTAAAGGRSHQQDRHARHTAPGHLVPVPAGLDQGRCRAGARALQSGVPERRAEERIARGSTRTRRTKRRSSTSRITFRWIGC